MTHVIREIKDMYWEKMVFITLLCGIVLSTFLYIYLVNKTVFNIVDRKNAESSILNVSADVTGLEYKLISKKNSLTLDTVREKGFEVPSSMSYISRKSLGQTLSMRSDL